MRLIPLAILLASAAAAQQPDAKTIMARVAANQDQSEAERAHYVYLQHARTASRKGKTVRCEEITEVRVVPTESGSHQQLLKLQGRLLGKHGQYQTYDHLAPDKDNPHSDLEAGQQDLSITVGDDNMDRDLVEHMRNNFTNDRSKDGIAAGLFPLTSKVQAQYQYRLVGRERITGRDVFHITFVPTDKDDFGWKGDAYIDTEAFQPVLVHTTMSRKLPFAVRTLLGTSLPGLGFTVTYAPQSSGLPGGLWFPVTFGTEFKMHVLFFINREITLNAENRNFEQTHVTSTILPAP